VLDRYYGTARRYVEIQCWRITADCPLVDPGIVEKLIGMYRTGRYDYVAVAAGADRGLTDGRFQTDWMQSASVSRRWRQPGGTLRMRETGARDALLMEKQARDFAAGSCLAEAHYPFVSIGRGSSPGLAVVSRIYEELGDGEGCSRWQK